MLESKQLDEIIKNNKYNFYAHTKESSFAKELLFAHLKLTYSYYEKMKETKNIDEIVKKLIASIFNTNEEITNVGYELFESAIYYHDIGKINPLFQKNKMKNDVNIKTESSDSNHSALSARLFIDSFLNIGNEKHSPELVILVFVFAYIISRHHSNMSQFMDFYKELEDVKIPEIEEIYKNKLNNTKLERAFKDLVCKYIKNENFDEISIYILAKLLYSCLITADFYATYEYMTGNEVDMNNEKDHQLFKNYEDSVLYNKIRKYENGIENVQGINKIRNEIFLESENNIIKNLNSNIYYLEAPTGAGKTNMAINSARILYEKNDSIKSINYIFPFNTIIEQTEKTFSEYFEEYKDFITINSITNMVKDENEILNYEEAYVKNVFRQYPITITSHINLFGSLFGEEKEINYSLYNYINSVVILDEIQSYSNNKWRQIIEMFDKYADMLNIKFIIMSATLPRWDKLLDNSKNKFTALIDDTNKYYQNPIFKNRVKINYELLDRKLELQELSDIIIKNVDKKVLVECIKKKTANELYNILKDKADNVCILTGDDNLYYRKKIIEKVKNDKRLILVSTQTIEAGVDIDMDIGYKDISFLDNEEQFLGRINRSSKKESCMAYFFNYDEASQIYKDDNRIGLSIKDISIRKLLEDKNFDGFYDKVLNRVENKTNKFNKDNITNLFSCCKILNFKGIEEKMKLIQNNTIQLFLNYDFDMDGRNISGKEVFNQYMELLKDNNMKYAEKKVRLSKINQEMNLFIYTIYQNELGSVKADQYGGMYYIKNGEDYIEDGRFNRKMFLKEGDSLFI